MKKKVQKSEKKAQKPEKKTQKSEKKIVKGEKKMKKSKSNSLPLREGSKTEKLYQILLKAPHSRKWLEEKKKINCGTILTSLMKRSKETGLFKVIRQKDGKYLVKKAA